jgi:hypothetical protein
MMDKPKGTTVVDIIVGKMKPTSKSRPPNPMHSSDFEEKVDAPDEKTIMKEAAAEEIMQAIKQSDAAALVLALQSFVDMCGESEEEKEDY